METPILPPLPVGISDFLRVREGNYYFVDKSRFIREVVAASAQVLLIPRPRRFGKTLNLSMLRYFFEKTEAPSMDLFEGMEIRETDIFHRHQGKYPVIYLTFKDLKDPSWEALFLNLTRLVRDEILRHGDLLTAKELHPAEKRYLQNIVEGEAGEADYSSALRYMSAYLSRVRGERVVILIDEYDTPIHAGYGHGYYDRVVEFLRLFLGGGLKDNANLQKGVLTGILRVGRESVFSGLNNLGVYTLLNDRFSDAFGFTDTEVRALLGRYEMSDRYAEAAFWYDGYFCGKTVLFNPWSLISYVDEGGRAYPYWVNTSDNQLIERFVTRGGRDIREEIGVLLGGGAIERRISESIVMREMDRRDDNLWSFLLFSGYLKATAQLDFERCRLQIPNNEVNLIYRNLVRTWFSEKIETNRLEEMLDALKHADIPLFETLLRRIVIRIMSYHDLSGEPEKVYHALMVGMLVWMSSTHEIRSNRESGYGRYDILLTPKDRSQLGIVLEFKRLDEQNRETPKAALAAAMEQIERRRYVEELAASGVRGALRVAVVFRGKKLWAAGHKEEIGGTLDVSDDL